MDTFWAGSFIIKAVSVFPFMRLTNTSYLAPKGQKDSGAIFELVEKVHQKLHGFSPLENCSKILRSFGRTQRDDGMQKYAVMYEFECLTMYKKAFLISLIKKACRFCIKQ